MKICYDANKSTELMDRILAKFNKEQEGNKRGDEMHVSDLTGCLMKPYCRLVGLEQAPMTKLTKGILIFGIVAENVLGWTFTDEELQFESSFDLVESETNIFGHIDIMQEKTDILEIKSTRKQVHAAKDIPVYWLEQLMSYMTMHSKHVGWIVFYNIVSTNIIAFRVEMTNDDILDWIIVLNERAILVRTAARDDTPDIVPIMPTHYTFCPYRKVCPRRMECRDRSKEELAAKTKKRRESAKKSSPLE